MNLGGFEDVPRRHVDTVNNKEQSKARDEKAPDALAAYCFENVWTGLTGDLADM